MRPSLLKFLRFLMTGMVNTAVDFCLTALLFALFPQKTLLSLFSISVVAGLCAILFSYLSNRYWTFREQAAKEVSAKESSLFFAFASLSMLANLSTFLFLVIHFANSLLLAKLGGAVVGAFVAFFTYNFVVFRSVKLEEFRINFHFVSDKRPFWPQALLLLLIAFLCRVAFLGVTTAITGDAVQYSTIAQKLALGDFDQIDRFWVSLFCYWQALFFLLKLSAVQAAVLSTLLPGILLILPVVWIAKDLFNSPVASLAGLFCAFHPRLISYSTNGYAEMFYLFFQLLGIAALLSVVRKDRINYALGWGVCFGIYTAVRNEGLLFFLLTLLLPVVAGRSVKSSGIALIAFCTTLGVYSLLAEKTVGTSGVFQKSAMVAKRYSEQLDYEKAAEEVYGAAYRERQSAADILTTLLIRLPENILYMLQRMPAILLSPLFLFALILPALTSIKWREQLALLMMGLFPLLFYPLIQLEPRYLFATLFPIHIFGSAGLYALCQYAERQTGRSLAKIALFFVTAAILCSNSLFSIWLGWSIERSYAIHRKLAQWLQSHTTCHELIMGDGYGYIGNTGFLSQNRFLPRLWTEDPQELIRSVKEHSSRFFILYEPFVERGNRALLSTFDIGFVGAKRVYEIKEGGARYQIYQIEGEQH